jgi:hypothetical protein
MEDPSLPNKLHKLLGVNNLEDGVGIENGRENDVPSLEVEARRSRDTSFGVARSNLGTLFPEIMPARDKASEWQQGIWALWAPVGGLMSD